MVEEYMFIILPVFALVSCVSVICILSYCKSRVVKNTETPVNDVTNRSNHVSSGSTESASRPATAIFIVPTTSQVIQMYISQANATAAANSVSDTTTNYRCKPPPSYGAVVVDVPPSYEQAIEHLDNGAK